eukprot:s473_g12.t1
MPDFICEVQIPVGTAGLQTRVPELSGHCRTSSASSRSQWALPDFNRDCQSPVGTAGLHPRAPDPSGHCRTSSASARSQWALPDFNCEPQIPVGTAGLHPRAPDASHYEASFLAPLADESRQKLPDFDGQGVANLVWSFTTLAFREEALLEAVALRCVAVSMRGFNSQGIANLCRALGSDAPLQPWLRFGPSYWVGPPKCKPEL